MSKYIQADKLIAEIERQKKHSQEAKMEFIDTGYNQNAFAEDCRLRSFDKLLSFITSLQQEQAEVDLEKEIIRYQREDMDRDTTVRDVARHFFNLGLNKRKEE